MKFLVKIFILLFCFSFGMADNFSKIGGANAVIMQVGDGKEFCPVCGMSLKTYYKTSHSSHLPGKEHKHYCSMRCLLADYLEHNTSLSNVLVADAHTDDLISAQSAFYVVGSDIKGTMSSVSNVAFSSEVEADKFVKIHGGEIKDFNSTLEMEKSSMHQDNVNKKAMWRKKIYPMGEKIYKNKCKEISPKKFSQINLLKAQIYHSCNEIKENEAQYVARYLWDVVREEKNKKVEVTQDDRCPVCGMFVYKHEGWIAKIYIDEKYFAFDGVKDMMKFTLNPTKYGAKKFNIDSAKFEVSDYYHANAIDAKEAFFVVGSDVFGPMGDELIAFSDEAEAKTFLKDHKGKAIYKFSEITENVVCKLDGGCSD